MFLEEGSSQKLSCSSLVDMKAAIRNRTHAEAEAEAGNYDQMMEELQVTSFGSGFGKNRSSDGGIAGNLIWKWFWGT